MSRRKVINLSAISSKITKTEKDKPLIIKNESIIKEIAKASSSNDKNIITSTYFSPKKTRNRIKIEYSEEPTKPIINSIKKSSIPLETTKSELNLNIKQEPENDNDDGSSSHYFTKPEKLITKNKIKLESPDEDLEDFNIVKTKQLKWEPKNWQQMLKNMRTMRSLELAPVDTMGCHKCADTNGDPKIYRFQTLIALMLSSQTKDQVTYDCMGRLKKHGLTPQNIVNTKSTVLEQLIYPVSFYKNKTKYIQKSCEIIIDKYDSDIPNKYEELIKLPGVGPKMGHICMNTAWNIMSGIGVDTHVHRISNRLNWLPKLTKQPEQTRVELEKWLPIELWRDVNELMVGFGQTICTPLRPKCNECLNSEICPSVNLNKKQKNK